MATTLSTNLKLRISDDLSADAKYNLNRIDLIGSLIDFSGSENFFIRAQQSITLQPNAVDVGGSGTGGIINLSSSTQPADDINIYSSEINAFGPVNLEELRLYVDISNPSSFYTSLQSNPAIASNVSFVLPVNDGNAGQLLSTDGSGNLSFIAPVSSLAASAVTVTPSGNLTSTNVQAALVELQLEIDAGTGAVDSVNSQTGVVVLDTDDIAEGGTNQYFTNGRFNTAFSGKSTTDLSEGTNLYYTDSRFDTRFGTRSVGALSDVESTAPVDQQVLSWVNANSRYENSDLGVLLQFTDNGDMIYNDNGAITILPIGDVGSIIRSDGNFPIWDGILLDQLDDVIITAPASTEVLTFNGTNWVNSPAAGGGGEEPVPDVFSGTGAQTAFTLSETAPNENWIDVFVEGVYQMKSTYSLSGTTLTFTEAPPSGTNNIEVIIRDY